MNTKEVIRIGRKLGDLPDRLHGLAAAVAGALACPG
jgi:hypothetical protein